GHDLHPGRAGRPSLPAALQRQRRRSERAHAAHHGVGRPSHSPARREGAVTVIPFAEWRPDMPALSQWAREALNVVADEESYRPVNALSGVSTALLARAQGAAWFRAPANVVKMFAGDSSKLYLLSGSTWNDVSRTSGGAYAPGAD